MDTGKPRSVRRGACAPGIGTLAARAIEIDATNRSMTTELQELQKRRNDASKQIGVLKGKSGTRMS